MSLISLPINEALKKFKDVSGQHSTTPVNEVFKIFKDVSG